MSNRVFVWIGHMGLGDRIRLVLERYGDRITDVSIFGWSVMRTGQLVETFDPAQLDEYRQRWPHLRFWLCFRNMDGPDAAEVGPRAIFDALRDSAAARARLADEVERIFGEFSWLHGVDIDLESGGDGRSEESEAIFQAVADRAHALGRQCSAALPPLTVSGSVGGENWVRYRQLGEILDCMEIMSYDFAWAGSAPGPISPGFWMRDVFDWVTSQVNPRKVFMGLPLYAYYWRLHATPQELGNPWRGLSGTYYSFWQQFTGATDWYDPGVQPRAGWLTYRDHDDGQSLWGFLHAYDWLQPQHTEESFGIQTDWFSGKHYAVRYGLPAGSPQWAIADNGPGDARALYSMRADPIIDVNGVETGPYSGRFTLTLEMLQRDAVAATIIDDYATSAQQLSAIYTQPDGDGSWSHWAQGAGSTVRQYRGQGRLEFNNDFSAQSLYVQARFQLTRAGTFTVYSQGVRAEMTNAGTIRLYNGQTLIGTANVGARAADTTLRSPALNVLALRVRENSARVYFSNAETQVPMVLEITGITPTGGPTGYSTNVPAWIDHTYLGHGWWYQPREAVEVTLDGQTRVMGRIPRHGVTWHPTLNMFRPDDDVNEPETHDPDHWRDYSRLDWTYLHWRDAPFQLGRDQQLRIIPLDHDVWWGRIIAFDYEGGFIAYCNDAQSVAHWRARAENDWNLAGIAMWSLGQEDVRLWEILHGGELPPDTKRLDQ
ncbi:glycosyl hydrolase family 18 protein [Nesterenkonia massiliensis]|uniref:Glycosyl hydrolase family 18 protein n=1 Tax=Nesterenkonia massiliensis TaxID=1232429 RepID=A0ABT2HR24_9MICC|nr:glycosyl hydrolase family 18 protein [Nesterenkonia massiliensis]MCT1607148.1 glycosyl hydrolase family 18 protein [Nesterenkonia massiliensis]